jgi:hypothetical protein
MDEYRFASFNKQVVKDLSNHFSLHNSSDGGGTGAAGPQLARSAGKGAPPFRAIVSCRVSHQSSHISDSDLLLSRNLSAVLPNAHREGSAFLVAGR